MQYTCTKYFLLIVKKNVNKNSLLFITSPLIRWICVSLYFSSLVVHTAPQKSAYSEGSEKQANATKTSAEHARTDT